MITIKAIIDENIPEILRVQRLCYRQELNEAAAAFLKKRALFPEGCLAAWDRDEMCGYIFSHPWRSGEIVPLDTGDYAIPTNPDCLYIHDLAVAPIYRGKNVSRAILKNLFEISNKAGWQRFALVAVQDSEPFWAHWGFKPIRTFEYAPGIKATYMACYENPKSNQM